MLETIESQTGDNPKYVIIWMHGLGADGNDFAPVVPQFNIPDLPLKFIFPHAPKIPVTINGGMVMRAWYDILSMDISRRIDEQGIHDSEKQILQLIESQIEQGYEYNQIVLAGFSQGGAMSLHISCGLQHKIAGIIALSCYLPVPGVLQKDNKPLNHTTPVFMGHGTQDPVVPYVLGEAGKTSLINKGFSIDWHSYPIQHGVSMDEISDIRQWMIKNLT